MATKFHGKNATIEIGTGSPLTLYCSFASWAVSFTRPKIDTSTFCDENNTSLLGNKDVSGSFEGFMTKEDMQALWTACQADTASTIRITPTTLEPGVFIEGPGNLTLDSWSGNYTDAIKVTVGFSANGNWDATFGFTSP